MKDYYLSFESLGEDHYMFTIRHNNQQVFGATKEPAKKRIELEDQLKNFNNLDDFWRSNNETIS